MKPFFKDMAERAIKTFAQGAIAALGAGATGLIGVDWINVLSIAGFATLVSILTSWASFNFGDDTASLINTKEKVNGDTTE
ncbi:MULTISPECIES: holin [unclassified Lactococcus]|uniref:holin n=1 Tax=unclassified Lactococcus TaxID=2643510 RepID=UPI0011C7A5F7|nr:MULTISPECIES: holin [unclassified Lactococcus]MQW23879.1 Holin [Lactococcus sp. dk101]TXK37109.1 Holin [Lactococcus sp. dk310]TXK47964.1 Holin [Lactococcus sp. dk322]